MKVKVIIEEVTTNTFEVDVNDPDKTFEEIRKMYKNGDLVVENPSLICVNAAIVDENGKASEFVDLHIP